MVQNMEKRFEFKVVIFYYNKTHFAHYRMLKKAETHLYA